MKYIKNLLIALDQLVNTVFGGNPDETISSRVGKRRDMNERFWADVIDAIFFWQPSHTKKSVEDVEERHK